MWMWVLWENFVVMQYFWILIVVVVSRIHMIKWHKTINSHCIIASFILYYTYARASPLVSGKESVCKAGAAGDPGIIPGLGRSPGGGHGNPLRCSCLENPMGRGTWWAAVHRAAKSWAWLKWLSTHACTHIYAWYNHWGILGQKYMITLYHLCNFLYYFKTISFFFLSRRRGNIKYRNVRWLEFLLTKNTYTFKKWTDLQWPGSNIKSSNTL